MAFEEKLTGLERMLVSGRQCASHTAMQHDAFGRLRITEPKTVFNDYHIYAKNDGTNGVQHWLYDLAGAGTSTYNTNESSVDLNVTTGSTDRVTKRTYRNFPYIPGRSQHFLTTAVLGAGEVGCEKRIGLFGDNNGLMFTEIDGTYGISLRTKTSGTVVNTTTTQANWNIDRMDGNGISGHDIDFTKAQIFSIDFQWLGAGAVRFGFGIDGKTYPCHTIFSANTKAVPYMGNASLPVSYEIKNTATLTAAQELKTICCSVSSEGGYDPSGPSFIVSNGVTLRTGITTREPILAVRLKNTFEGLPNRISAQMLSFSVYATAKAAYFELAHVTGATTITGNWTSVEDKISGCEVSVDVSEVSGGTEHLMDNAHAPAAGGARAANVEHDIKSLREPKQFITQNFDSDASQLFVIFATGSGGTSSVSSSMKWQELQ